MDKKEEKISQTKRKWKNVSYLQTRRRTEQKYPEMFSKDCT